MFRCPYIYLSKFSVWELWCLHLIYYWSRCALSNYLSFVLHVDNPMILGLVARPSVQTIGFIAYCKATRTPLLCPFPRYSCLDIRKLMHEPIAIKPNWLYVTWASLSIAIFWGQKKKTQRDPKAEIRSRHSQEENVNLTTLLKYLILSTNWKTKHHT